jgi:hypothetical protein
VTELQTQDESTQDGQKHDGLTRLLLEVRPHLIGILRAVNRALGTSGESVNVKCPDCGKRFSVDKRELEG